METSCACKMPATKASNRTTTAFLIIVVPLLLDLHAAKHVALLVLDRQRIDVVDD
jgi:hypothetical protein